VVTPQVRQFLAHKSPQPAHESGLVLARELGKLPDNLDQRLLDHVRELQPLAQSGPQTSPHNHPQIVPVKGAKLSQRVFLSGACTRQ
jgi:hypothetical protein